MASTKWARKTDEQGYVRLAAELRSAIAAGKIPVGGILAPTREIGSRYGVSPETARRAVKLLEGEGLVVSAPRHGYRVLARANDPERGMPVAFVASGVRKLESWKPFNRMLFAGLQQAASDYGWSLLAVGTGERSIASIQRQLQQCRVCGLVLDTGNDELVAACQRMGLPVVMMDAWDAEMRLDAVVQDGFQGSLQAARFLAGRGHERIAWLGSPFDDAMTLERFAGACAGIVGAGRKLHTDLFVRVPWADMETAARRLLTRKDRPTAVLGLWNDAVAALVRVAGELGLKQGRDVEFVGWSPEEDYDPIYRAFFPAGQVPAAMVWSVAELASVAMARLDERRQKPSTPPTLTKIPVRIRLPGKENPASQSRTPSSEM